jgi:simple sugar transport system permease protein
VAFAAVGETLSEQAGVMNLGLEGMMLIGAMTAVATAVETGSLFLAVVAAAAAAALLAAVHAYVTVVRQGNQIVSGVALSIIGVGLSGFLGRSYVGVRFHGMNTTSIPGLQSIPVLGPIFFQQDILVYAAIVSAAIVSILLYRTRFGLHVRAVGEDTYAAYTHGVAVNRTRIIAVVCGGMLAGVGGAYLSLAYTQLWAEKMTAGQGWIAVGLVVLARWRPFGALFASYAFGFLAVLHPHLQAAGITISPYLIATLPYLGAVAAITITTILLSSRGYAVPATLARNALGSGER